MKDVVARGKNGQPIRRRVPKTPKAKAKPPLPPPTAQGFIDIAMRSGKLAAIRLLWRNAREMGLLTPEVRQALTQRASEIQRNGDK